MEVQRQERFWRSAVVATAITALSSVTPHGRECRYLVGEDFGHGQTLCRFPRPFLLWSLRLIKAALN